MVPAPDEFPDFDNMSPEEQMAWLESLARRQGANADEFMTAADQSIPVPEDVDVDEPGYVPYSISEGGRMEHDPEPPPGDSDDTEELRPEEMEDAAAPGDDAPDPREDIAEDAEVEEFPPVVEDVEFQADAFVAAPELTDPDDPSETGIADMEDEAIDETLSDDDLADPMTWLDSLTPQSMTPDDELLSEIERAAQDEEFRFEWGEEEKEQAAKLPTSDPTSAMDFDALEDLGLDGFEEVDLAEEARIENELAAPPAETSEPSDAEATPAAVDEFALREAAGDESGELELGDEAEPESIGEWADEDVLDGADPMTWLETLARRQGADVEELTTGADLEIPELPEDTVVDEPGYTEYSPFGILPPHRDTAPQSEAVQPSTDAGVGEKPELPEDLESLSQSVGWLSDITEEPEGDLTAWLAIEDTFAERELREDDGETDGIAPPSVPDDALAGMTDEEIELALRRGELTGEQELAWLQRTARNRAAQLEESSGAAEPEEVAPAEPAELPSWLQAMRDSEAAEEGVMEGAAGLFDADALESDAAGVLDLATPHEDDIDEAELAALLDSDTALDEADALAEALAAELESDFDAEADEPLLAEAAPIEMPDWLVEADEEGAAGAELPAWLSEPAQESAVPAEDMPDWLSELRENEAAQSQLPPEDAPSEAEIEPEPEFLAPRREAPIPEGELFASYRQRLEEEPGDHASRLALARTLRSHGEVSPSLDHYETLIENAQLLEDVSNDLASLVGEQPHQPRARRLLGDTLMRQGRLHDALDAYRTALEQL